MGRIAPARVIPGDWDCLPAKLPYRKMSPCHPSKMFPLNSTTASTLLAFHVDVKGIIHMAGKLLRFRNPLSRQDLSPILSRA